MSEPTILEDVQTEVQQHCVEEDVSINKISEWLDISYGTARSYVQRVKSE